MRLERLVIQNFGSFKGQHAVTLANAGLTLIEGVNKDDPSATSNGAAKSTIIDAMFWCLYGLTTHEPTAEGDEVVNDRVGRDCLVSIGLTVGKRRYVVMRGRQMRDRELFGAKHGLKLVRDDLHDLTKGTTRETQAEIVRVLGMSASTFRHAVLFGQSKAFRFVRLNDTDKKAVLDEMIGAELYASAGELAGKQLSYVTERLLKAAGAYDLASHSLKRELENLEELSRMTAKVDKRANRELAAAHAKKRQELAKNRGSFEAVDQAKRALSEAERVLKAAKRAENDASDVVASVEREINKLQDSLERFQNLADASCPTCEQDVPKSHVARTAKRTQRAIEEAEQKLREATDEHAAEEVMTRVAEKQHRETTALLSLAESLLRERRTLQSEAESLETKLQATRDTQKLADTAIARKQRVVGTLRAQKKKQRSLVAKLQIQKAQLEFWREGFSTRGLRSLMMDNVLPFLNAKLETYSNAITAGNIKVQFKTQRKLKSGKTKEEFHVEVANKYGAQSYKQSSIGERAKVDLVVGMALQDMAAAHSRVPVNVAFFDEAFEGLDPAGCSRVMSELSNIARHRESIFVITHLEAFKAFVSRKITVVKKNGVSRIE